MKGIYGTNRFVQKNKVFLDTAPLIYFIKGNSEYQNILRQLFEENDKGEFEFLTSAITLGEVLVMPLRKGEENLAKQHEQILRNSKHLKINEINIETSILSGKIKKKSKK